MNSIIDWAVNSTRLIMAMIVVVVIAGVAAFITIPKEADPDIAIPIIYVSIVHPGISPEDAERLLIKPVEAQLRSIEGVKKMNSIGSLGHASVVLEFNVNFDKEKALQDVRAKVDIAAAELPEDAEEPTVHEVNTAIFPVITVALSGDLPERALLKIAKDLEDRIEGIPSVLEVDLVGQREELLEIIIDPAKMDSYGLSQAELLNAVRMNNQLVAAGELDTGRGKFAVKVPGLFETRDDVLALVVRSNADGVVTLADIADIRSTFYDATSYSQYNGKPSISLEVTKRIGENIIDTNQKVRSIVAEAQKTWPAGVEVDFALDASDWIKQSLGSLSDSIVLAVVLVMIIVVAALGLRSGLLVGFAIPASFMISFFLLQTFGYTLNMMIMFGMLLAVGILVDGAIIVVEYADRKMTEGMEPRQAFADAAKRMFWPVTSATGTMLAAFLPMLLWPGVSGKFMSYFPITLIFVLSASLVVALIFLPVLGGLFGKREDADEEHVASIEASETGDWRKIGGVTGGYAHVVEWVTRHPFVVGAGAIVLAVAVSVSTFMFGVGVEFFVTTDPSQAILTVSARGNLSASEKRDLVFEVEKSILDVDGIQSIMTSSGGGGQSFGFGGASVAEDTVGRIFLEFTDYRTRRKGAEILEEVRERTSHFAGIRIEIQEAQQGPPTGKAISLELASDNIPALLQATQHVREYFNKMPELRDVEDTRPLPGIEWALQIDREQAGRFGADVIMIGTAVQLVTNGIKIGEYRPDDSDEEVDIRVRYPIESRGLGALDTLRVTTKEGLVPISNFVKLKPQQQVNAVNRADGLRVYRIRANTAPEILPAAMVAQIKTWIDSEAQLPKDVTVRYRGADEQQDESMGFLMFFALPAAFFMIFAVLLAMFNSFYHAILILVAAIMAVFGAFLGMVVMQQPFSVIMSGTGILALIGIVVNHNIVLIDTYHKLTAGGMERMEAVIRSSAQRLRPVFLTTLTAVLGLLPMMLAVEINFVSREVTFGAPAALWWVSLSTAIIFGLVFSKLITLGLTPAMLAMPGHVKPFFARVWGGMKRQASSLAHTHDASKPASAALPASKEQHREAAE